MNEDMKFSERDYKNKYNDHMARIHDWLAIDTEYAKMYLQRLHNDAR